MRTKYNKTVTFVTGNMKLVSFSLFLDAFPPRPKMLFLQRHVAIHICNICKGHFGSGGGEAYKNKLKDSSFIFPMINVTILGSFCRRAQKEYGKFWEINALTPLTF